MKFQVTDANVVLDVARCYDCGRWWAVEQAVMGTCPWCAHKQRTDRDEEMDRLLRVVRALRGAISRAKKLRARRGDAFVRTIVGKRP